MREVTIAVVQMQPLLNEPEKNLGRMAEWVEEICRTQKTDLIIFPELAVTGYECGKRFTDLAERIPGPTINTLAQRAGLYNTHIAFGMVTKERVESILYDTAILLGPDGELLGPYHKVHLRGEERLNFRPGFKFPVFETTFGAVGLLLGWDLAFPEAARNLVLDGAELICVLANWEVPHTEEWRSYLVARAYENACFVAGTNRVGQEYTYQFFGESMVIGPRGELFASVEGAQEGFAVARVDLDSVKQVREEYQLLQYRQPQTYRSIVRKY